MCTEFDRINEYSDKSQRHTDSRNVTRPNANEQSNSEHHRMHEFDTTLTCMNTIIFNVFNKINTSNDLSQRFQV